MPHDGLMDERALGPEHGPLQRARLHIRGGRRRLRQGKTAAGIVTLYDALEGALTWFVASAERRQLLRIHEGENLNDERALFRILQRSGFLDQSFDYDAFDRIVERATREEMSDFDYRDMLSQFESVMTQLGVMPFDEGDLPPEDPSTY
jgi:hypothetical protein